MRWGLRWEATIILRFQLLFYRNQPIPLFPVLSFHSPSHWIISNSSILKAFSMLPTVCTKFCQFIPCIKITLDSFSFRETPDLPWPRGLRQMALENCPTLPFLQKFSDWHIQDITLPSTDTAPNNPPSSHWVLPFPEVARGHRRNKLWQINVEAMERQQEHGRDAWRCQR